MKIRNTIISTIAIASALFFSGCNQAVSAPKAQTATKKVQAEADIRIMSSR